MLAPETPYPLAGGGALRTASLLHYLARKYETDLIVFREPGAPDPASGLPRGLVRRVTVIDLPANRRDAPARMLRNASRLARRVPPLVDRFAGFGEAVSRALDGQAVRTGGRGAFLVRSLLPRTGAVLRTHGARPAQCGIAAARALRRN